MVGQSFSLPDVGQIIDESIAEDVILACLGSTQQHIVLGAPQIDAIDVGHNHGYEVTLNKR